MPKKVLSAGDFSSGINKAADARDIRNSELRRARNIDVFSPGLIKNISDTEPDLYEYGGIDTQHMQVGIPESFNMGMDGQQNAGYGLFSIDTDYPFLSGKGYNHFAVNSSNPHSYTNISSSRQVIWQSRGGVCLTSLSEANQEASGGHHQYSSTWLASQWFGMGAIESVDANGGGDTQNPEITTVNPHRASVGDYVYVHDTNRARATFTVADGDAASGMAEKEYVIITSADGTIKRYVITDSVGSGVATGTLLVNGVTDTGSGTAGADEDGGVAVQLALSGGSASSQNDFLVQLRNAIVHADGHNGKIRISTSGTDTNGDGVPDEDDGNQSMTLTQLVSGEAVCPTTKDIDQLTVTDFATNSVYDYDGIWRITTVGAVNTMVLDMSYGHNARSVTLADLVGGTADSPQGYFTILPRHAQSGFPQLQLKYEAISGVTFSDDDNEITLSSNTTLRPGQFISGAGIVDNTIILGAKTGAFGADITVFYISRNTTAANTGGSQTIYIREGANLVSRGYGNSFIRSHFNSDIYDNSLASYDTDNLVSSYDTETFYDYSTSIKDVSTSKINFGNMRVLPKTWYIIKLKLRRVVGSDYLKISVVHCCKNDRPIPTTTSSTDFFPNGLTAFNHGYPLDSEETTAGGVAKTDTSTFSFTRDNNNVKDIQGMLYSYAHSPDLGNTNPFFHQGSTSEVSLYDSTVDLNIDVEDEEVELTARFFTSRPNNVYASKQDFDLILEFENFHDGTSDTAGDVLLEIDSIHMYPDSYQNITNIPSGMDWSDFGDASTIHSDSFGESYLFLDDSLKKKAISVYSKNFQLEGLLAHWGENIIDYGSESGQISYLQANEAVRISDANFKNVNNKNKWVGHIHRTMYKNAEGWPNGSKGCLSWEEYGWYVYDSFLEKPKEDKIQWSIATTVDDEFKSFDENDSTDMDDLETVADDHDWRGSMLPWNSMKGKGATSRAGETYDFLGTFADTGDYDIVNADTRMRYRWPVYYDENFADSTRGYIGLITDDSGVGNFTGNTYSAPNATFTGVATGHGLEVGDLVRISNSANHDGTYNVQAKATNTFAVRTATTSTGNTGQFVKLPLTPTLASIYGAINNGDDDTKNPSIGAVKIIIEDIPNSTLGTSTVLGEEIAMSENLSNSQWYVGVSYIYDGFAGLSDFDTAQDSGITYMKSLISTNQEGLAPDSQDNLDDVYANMTGHRSNYYWGGSSRRALNWNHADAVAAPGVQIHWCHGQELTQWNKRITGMRVWIKRKLDKSSTLSGLWKLLMDIRFDDGEYDFYGGIDFQTHPILGWNALTMRDDDAIGSDFSTYWYKQVPASLDGFSVNKGTNLTGLAQAGNKIMSIEELEGVEGERWSTNVHAIEVEPTLDYESHVGCREEDLLKIKYKTAVVINNVTYAGNIGVLSESGAVKSIHGDKILKSLPGKFDTFSSWNFLLGGETNDGDNIIKLLSFGNILVIFKTKKILIYDSSDTINDKLIKTIYNNGISNPASAIVVREGVVWVNKTGVFHYDGQEFVNLFELNLTIDENQFRIKRIDLVYWKGIVGEERDTRIPMIMYDGKSDKLIVAADINENNPYNLGTNGGGLIYDFISKGWIEIANMLPSGKINMTNAVTHWDGRPIFATSGLDSSGHYSDTGYNIWAYNDSKKEKDNNEFDFITKDFDFGQPFRRKSIKNIYITFRTKGLHQNIGDSYQKLSHDVYRHSNCHVYYSINGKQNFIEFDNSSINYATGSNHKGLKVENPYVFKLSEALHTYQNSITPVAKDFAHLSIGDKLVIGAESLVITSLDEDTLEVGLARFMYGFNGTPGTHNSESTVSVYTTGWVIAKLKPSADLSVRNIYSFQMRFRGEELGTITDVSKMVPNGFEINDINIVFREKVVT